jgi:hypothetical protein
MKMPPRVVLAVFLGVIAVFASVSYAASRHASSTFDEVLLSAAGARGYETGNFDLVRLYHPRLPVFLYGLPVHSRVTAFPVEVDRWEDRGGFPYSRQLFFQLDNPTHDMVLAARRVAVVISVGLLGLVLAFGWVHAAPAVGLLAATILAFLPDVMAHGAIAYNDVPVALAILAAVWALDRAARRVDLRSSALAGLLVGVALATKFTSIALAPITLGLFLLEAGVRGREWRAYLGKTIRSAWVILISAYLTLVAIHFGDFTLGAFGEGFAFNLAHAAAGSGNPTWFMGALHDDPIWYFYPLILLLKTPVAFHLLVVMAVVGAVLVRTAPRDLLASPLRGPIVALAVLGFLVLTSSLQIGSRHAIPLLPFAVLLVAAGVVRVAERFGRPALAAVVLLVGAQAASTLSWYPHFLPYITEFVTDRDQGHLYVADSSHDWGQGLIELRRFMEEEGESTVYLGAFGSWLPEAYGIGYVPLESFFLLPAQPEPSEPPRFMVVSATNLGGGYVAGAYAGLRARTPYRVLGHTMFVYEVDGDPRME